MNKVSSLIKRLVATPSYIQVTYSLDQLSQAVWLNRQHNNFRVFTSVNFIDICINCVNVGINLDNAVCKLLPQYNHTLLMLKAWMDFLLTFIKLKMHNFYLIKLIFYSILIL